MTLNDPKLTSQGHAIIYAEYLRNCMRQMMMMMMMMMRYRHNYNEILTECHFQ